MRSTLVLDVDGRAGVYDSHPFGDSGEWEDEECEGKVGEEEEDESESKTISHVTFTQSPFFTLTFNEILQTPEFLRTTTLDSTGPEKRNPHDRRTHVRR